MRTESIDRGETGPERGGEISAALVNEMTPLLRAFCRRYVLNSAVADDVVQQTFEIALRSSADLREPSKVRAWMFTIARRESLRVLRAHDSAPLPEDLSDDRTPSPESHTISSDIMGSITAGLDALPLLYRQAVVLRDIEGFSYAEIAATTGASLATVKFRIYKGREMLMEKLAPVIKEWRTP